MIRPNGCLATLFQIPWIALRAARARLLGGGAQNRRRDQGPVADRGRATVRCGLEDSP